MKISKSLDELSKALYMIDRAKEKNEERFLKETADQARYVIAQLSAAFEQLESSNADKIQIAKDITKILNSSDHLLDLEFDYNKADRMYKDYHYLGGE